jgi:hypothetical protein
VEEYSTAGLMNWGWQDNAYGLGIAAPSLYFATTGLQTVRIQQREDGISIDQIVISPAKYLSVAPGLPKGDATIVPKREFRVSRAACRARAAAQALRPAPVSIIAPAPVFVRVDEEGRHGLFPPVPVDRDKGQIGPAGHLAPARQRFLREHLDLHFQRCREGAGHPGPEDDQVPHLDRVQELQPVNGRRDQQASRMAMAGNRPGDVDQMHDRAAQNEAKRVGVIRQDHLDHFRGGFVGPLRCEIHRASIGRGSRRNRNVLTILLVSSSP